MPENKSAICVPVALMSMSAGVAVARLADMWMSGKVPGTKVTAEMTADMTAGLMVGMMMVTRPEIETLMAWPTELEAVVWPWQMPATCWTDASCPSRWSGRARRVRLASHLTS